MAGLADILSAAKQVNAKYNPFAGTAQTAKEMNAKGQNLINYQNATKDSSPADQPAESYAVDKVNPQGAPYGSRPGEKRIDTGLKGIGK
jgi:hypothetical protein